jgi:Ran GTPase-activating protein (RanGAP) involved in mRNA processing and transport
MFFSFTIGNLLTFFDSNVPEIFKISKEDTYVPKGRQVGIFPVSDTPSFSSKKMTGRWETSLRYYQANTSNTIVEESATKKDDQLSKLTKPPSLSKSQRETSHSPHRSKHHHRAHSVELSSNIDVTESVKIDLPNNEIQQKYFGEDAQILFGNTYRELHHQAELLTKGRSELRERMKDKNRANIFHVSNDDDDFSTSLFDSLSRPSQEEGEEEEENETYKSSYSLQSPRAIFLAGCLEKGLAPRAITMLRKRISPVLDLRHMGIGNETAFLLAEAMEFMPYLHTLLLADNNLDDLGLAAIIRAAARKQNPQLSVLDISKNIVDDEASASLAEFIGNAHCQLQALYLSAGDIDDGECAHFIEVLMNNRQLKLLDLSNNLIGKDENLNVVQPDFTTGAEALATLLEANQCPLQSLFLQWNMIRLQGACVLCKSLTYNTHLQELNVSYNALGGGHCDAVCILGAALLENHHLKYLNLGYNAIDSVGVMTLSVGMCENHSLERVILDGNPLGEQGARAMMRVICYTGHRLHISAQNCDIFMKNHKYDKFFINYPNGEYYLDMSIAYDRAIVYAILDLVANDTNLDIARCDYYYSETSIENLMIHRFEEMKHHLHPEETKEESFNALLAPLCHLNANFLHNTVREYDKKGSECFPTQSLSALWNHLIYHERLQPIQAIRKLRRFNSIVYDKLLNVNPEEIEKEELTKEENLLDQLVHDSKHLLDSRNTGNKYPYLIYLSISIYLYIIYLSYDMMCYDVFRCDW